MLREFLLPDLGEGLTESEVVSWRVEVGDRIELNQIIADIETAKAIVELPSPFAGTVAALHAEPGETVEVGAPLLSFDIESPAETASDVSTAPEPNLVGYGAAAESTTARRRMRPAAAASSTAPNMPVPEPVATVEVERPRSTPPVRKLARDRGIDLAGIHGTGLNGRITRDDLLAPMVEVSKTDDVRIPVKGMRKATAAAMVASAFTAPHVTEFLTIDVTESMELLARLKADRDLQEQRITFLTICAKAVCMALARNPSLNSRWDEAAQEIIQFGSVNLGIAAATPRGLLVPNIRDASRLDFAGLADALTDLTTQARAGSTSPESLRDGTFTITNIGVFGIDAGTPILNPGEAGILAVGAVRSTPWAYRGEVALRQVLTLSLSFDHRVVDGAEGSRFLADVGSLLRDPSRALAFG